MTNTEMINGTLAQLSEVLHRMGYQQISFVFGPNGLLFNSIITDPDAVSEGLSDFIETTLDEMGKKDTSYPVGPILLFVETLLRCKNVESMIDKGRKFKNFMEGQFDGLSNDEFDEFIQRAVEVDSMQQIDKINMELTRLFDQLDEKYNLSKVDPEIRSFIHRVAIDELHRYRTYPLKEASDKGYGDRLQNLVSELCTSIGVMHAYLKDYSDQSKHLVTMR